MIPDFSILLIIVGLIAFVTLLMEISIRRGIVPAVIGRKITHMANGVFCILAIPLMDSLAIQIAVGSTISLVALLAVKRRWLSMDNPEFFKSSLGIFYFPLSFTILVFMWGKELEAVSMMSLLIMSFSDSTASLIGGWVGRIEFNLRGGKKTLEGSLVFFLMTIILFYIISITPSFSLPLPGAWNLYSWWASAIVIAILLTFLEAMSFRGSDNITVPLLGSILLHHLIYDSSWEKVTPFYFGLLFSLILAFASLRLKILDRSGALGAVVVGTWIFGFGQWTSAIPLLFFFFSSGLLGVVGRSQKKTLKTADSEKSGRTLAQVMANGGLPTIILAIGIWQEWEFLFELYLVLMATATADTWATEIGTALKGSRTFSIINLKPMPQGTSGGISVEGSLGALLGSTAVAAFGFVLVPHFTLSAFGSVAALGFIGSMLDSLIGNLWQRRYLSEEGVRSDYPDEVFQQKAGVDWMNNDMVNFFSGLVMAIVAILVFAL